MAASLGFLKSVPVSSDVFLSVATPIDYITACGIECNAAYEVDWGDGNFIIYAAGRNDVVPTGLITIRSNNPVTWHRYHTDTFLNIDIQQSSTLDSLYITFYNLRKLENAAINDTSKITTFYSAFEYCQALQSVPNLSFTSAINVSRIFYRCSSLTSLIIGDMPLVTELNRSFSKCYSLEEVIIGNMPSINNLSRAFDTSTNLQRVTLGGTGNATDFSYMFYNCRSLYCINAINTLLQTSTNQIFTGCQSLINPTKTEQSAIISGLNYSFNGFPCSLFYTNALARGYNIINYGTATMEIYHNYNNGGILPPSISSITFAINSLSADIDPWVADGFGAFKAAIVGADVGSYLYYEPPTSSTLGYGVLYMIEWTYNPALVGISANDFNVLAGMRLD